MQVVQDKCIEKRGFGAWPTDENFFFFGALSGAMGETRKEWWVRGVQGILL